MPVQFQIVVFAVIAAFVLFQLYNVLGKKVGRQPQEDAKTPLPAPTAAESAKVQPAVDAATQAAVAGLKARDPAFDPARFVEGARQAYEIIVRGYAAGDRAALKPLLTPAVMASFEAGIAAREARGGKRNSTVSVSPRVSRAAMPASNEAMTVGVRRGFKATRSPAA